MSEMSLAAMVEGGGKGDVNKSYGFTPSPFFSDIGAAAQSRELENNFALVFAMEVEKLETTNEMQAVMEKLNTLLDEVR